MYLSHMTLSLYIYIYIYIYILFLFLEFHSLWALVCGALLHSLVFFVPRVFLGHGPLSLPVFFSPGLARII